MVSGILPSGENEMIIIVHDEKKIVTRMIECNKEQINTVAEQLNLEHYHTYEETNAYIGISIDYLSENGMIKSDKQLVEEKLIVLQTDEILEGDSVRKLTLQEQVDKGMITLEDNEEIRDNIIETLSDDDMQARFPERYSEPEIDPIDKELYAIEDEIRAIEDEVLQSIIQDRMEGKI